MDASDDRDRMGEVRDGHDDEDPSGRFDSFPTEMVLLALLCIPFVVPAVMLDDDTELREHQIASRQPSSIVVEHVDIGLRLRKPGKDEQQPKVGLAKRVDSLAHHGGRLASSDDPVEVRVDYVAEEPIDRGLAAADQRIAGADETANTQQRGAVDERPIGSKNENPTNRPG